MKAGSSTRDRDFHRRVTNAADTFECWHRSITALASRDDIPDRELVVTDVPNGAERHGARGAHILSGFQGSERRWLACVSQISHRPRPVFRAKRARIPINRTKNRLFPGWRPTSLCWVSLQSGVRAYPDRVGKASHPRLCRGRS